MVRYCATIERKSAMKKRKRSLMMVISIVAILSTMLTSCKGRVSSEEDSTTLQTLVSESTEVDSIETQESTEKATISSIVDGKEKSTEVEIQEIEHSTGVTEETVKEETLPIPSEEVVSFESVDETVYATTTVNVRSGPSTSHSKVGSLNFGQEVQRTGIGNNGWSKVMYNGKESYVHSDYLSTENPVPERNVSGYPLSYSDSTVTITIYREWYEDAWCYAAHVQLSDYSRMATDCAYGSYGSGSETTSDAASRLNAIFAVNGCYSAPYLDYIVVRDGQICNGGYRSLWVPGVYSQYTGELLSAWETNGTPGVAGQSVSSMVSSGIVTDTFNFGPPILQGGSICAGSGGRAQATFIGTNGEPGDIWVVVSDGRYNDGESTGLTAYQCAEYLQSKGCTFGIPLDGGGSSTMVFQGVVLNAAAGNERAIVDFLYIR